MSSEASSGKLTLFLVALAFFGPMAIATWMYFSGQDVRTGANHGVLLSPVENLGDTVPDSALLDSAGERLWRVVYVGLDDCGESCVAALYKQRQTWKMLGREMDRVGRVFLHGDTAPDSIFIDGEHPDLLVSRDDALASRLLERLPDGVTGGGFFLIDPNNNLVLYFQPDIEPKDLVSDLKRLLKISQIG